jgi:hypothetical protein
MKTYRGDDGRVEQPLKISSSTHPRRLASSCVPPRNRGLLLQFVAGLLPTARAPEALWSGASVAPRPALVVGDLSFARQPGVNRKQIRAFAELEFIAKAENIVFIGPRSRQTGLASGLL